MFRSWRFPVTATTVASSRPATRAWPGPRGQGPLGSLREAWADPIGLLEGGVRTHGDLVRFRFAWLRYHLVADLDAVHRVVVENAKGYKKSRNYEGLRVLLGDGLLTSEGDTWRKNRRLAQPAFARAHLDGFARTMARSTLALVHGWDARVSAGATELDLHAEMMRLTLRIVGLTLLGADLEGDANELGRDLEVALKWANAYVESVVRVPPWVPTPTNVRFVRSKRAILEVVNRVITQRRAGGAPAEPDLLALLMAASDDAEAHGDLALVDEIVTLTLAGHETTANGLTFALVALARHPDVLARVRAEIDAVLGAREAPDLADLPNLPYTKAVVDEALRLWPPAWSFEREAVEDDVVCGLPVPKGATVVVSPWVLHRHPKLWDAPRAFRPARFLEKDPARPKLAYLPFGAGPRVCIGASFALTEMQILLATIVRRFDVVPLVDGEVPLDPSITLRPKGGLRARLARRA